MLSALTILIAAVSVGAQEPAPAQRGRGGGGGQQAPQVVSPEVLADKKITFRLYAPQAQPVRLTASDIQGLGQAATLTKADSGVCPTTVGPIQPGAYRYTFNVDGVATIDPRSPSVSELQFSLRNNSS